MENLPRIKQGNTKRINCVRKAKKHGKMRKSRAERSGKTVSANISVSMVRHVVTPRKPNKEAEKENPPDTNVQAGSRRFVLLGVARLELAASTSQMSRAANCATPRYPIIIPEIRALVKRLRQVSPRNGRRNGRRFASASLPSHAGPADQAPPHPSRCSRCSHPSRRFRRSRGFERTQAPRRPRPPSCLACFACIRGSISAKFVKSLDLSVALCYNLQKEQICFL